MSASLPQASEMPKQVSLRLPDGVWEQAEAVAEHMAEQPEFAGLAVSPSRALIQAILRGLPLLMEEHGLQEEQGASSKRRRR